jgi:NAD+ diphosphatase
VLLAVRGRQPHKGMLDAFGGFLDGEETTQAAAERELQEELSLQPSDYEPLSYLTSAIGHFTYINESIPVLSTFFWTRLKTTKTLQPSDDVAGIRTIPLDEVNLDMLHDDDIRTGISALRQEIGTTKST